MNQLTQIERINLLGLSFNVYGDKDEPLFLAKDIANAIEHSDVSMMCKNLDETEKVTSNVCTPGGEQSSLFLTEDGVYEVLMTSRKPIAKDLRKGLKLFLKAWRKKEVKVIGERESALIDLFSNDPMVVANANKKLIDLATKPLLNEIRSQNEFIEYQGDRLQYEKAIVEHKTSVIHGMLNDFTLADKRARINEIVRFGSAGYYSHRYNLLYNEFNMKYGFNVEVRRNNFNKDKKKTKQLSTMQYIEKELKMIPELYKVCVGLFEADLLKLLDEKRILVK